jgi:hypothetical protein
MDEVGALSLRELGGLIVTNRAAIDAAEAGWLAQVEEFDRRGGWALDGHGDCAAWLAHHCGMARSTANDRLRIAHELRRRPVLAAALAEAQLSFSKIKILTRIVDVDDDTDEVLATAAAVGTIADVDRIYKHWKLHDEQTKALTDRRWDKRGVQTLSRYNGFGNHRGAGGCRRRTAPHARARHHGAVRGCG